MGVRIGPLHFLRGDHHEESNRYLFVHVLILFMSPRFSASQESEVIKLPAPQTEGGKPLMQALKLRQSTRGDYGPEEKLPMQTLSNLLWAADGVNRPDAQHANGSHRGGLEQHCRSMFDCGWRFPL